MLPNSITQAIKKKAEEYSDKTFVWPKNKKGEDIVQRVGQNAPFSKKHKNNVIPHYTSGYSDAIEFLIWKDNEYDSYIKNGERLYFPNGESYENAITLAQLLTKYFETKQ